MSSRRNQFFPYLYASCPPQRRGTLPYDMAQHDRSRYRISGPEQFHVNTQGATFHALNPPPTGFSASASPSPLSVVTAWELNTFVQTELEPDTEYNRSCNAVVDRLCQFMQNSFPGKLRPSEVLKAGSLGKGTAVKGKSDADLVVFLANYRSIFDLSLHLRVIFAEMKLYLGRYGGCVITGTTRHALQVSVHCHGHSHDADILPSVDILKRKTLHDIYKEMESAPFLRDYYSAALTSLQIDFVSHIPPKVKNLVRLMKFWKKTNFEESTSYQRLPSSFLLELIVINEWKRAGSPEDFDLRKGFYQVLSSITHYRTMRLAYTQHYKFHHCHDDFFVMDPANPFNNVMNSCKCWETVAEKARSFLRIAPLFTDLPGLLWL
ncbi:2'-5'-oligoadenylate synthase 1A-like isoform X2 [Crassostrea virginica]